MKKEIKDGSVPPSRSFQPIPLPLIFATAAGSTFLTTASRIALVLSWSSHQQTGIVIVESTAKAMLRPYHKKKLVLLIANMRHFALEQAARGCSVIYHFSSQSHGHALLKLQSDLALPELTVTKPAERELRIDLAQAASSGLKLHEVPDTTWLSTSEDFLSVYGPYKPAHTYVVPIEPDSDSAPARRHAHKPAYHP